MSTLATFRPRSALEIVDASFHLYREHFGEVVSIALITQLPFAILAFFFSGMTADLIDRASNLALPIAHGATAVLIYAALSGRRLGIGESFREIQVGLGSLIVI